MRHRRRSRVLGRSPSHRKALLRNLTSALFLTEREVDEDFEDNAPKVKGRIVTTLEKAKEVRPLVEKCITIARKSLKHQEKAAEFATDAERNSNEWRSWRKSEQWQQWNQAIAPVVNARRRVIQLIGDKEAASILFDSIAPRFADRDGGYTRILRLAKPRLGDAGTRAILELVGKNDRVRQVSERPAFGGADDDGGSEGDSESAPEEQLVGAGAADGESTDGSKSKE